MLRAKQILSSNIEFDCKRVSQVVLQIAKQELEKTSIKRPRISIILPNDSSGNPNFASEVYVRNKVKVFKELGVDVQIDKINPEMSLDQVNEKIACLNNDSSIKGMFFQLPISPQFRFQTQEVIEKISPLKDLDGLTSASIGKFYYGISTGIQPATALGIGTLLSYYDIRTEGKKVLLVGKGNLVGRPLANMLMAYPFFARITMTDVFSGHIQDSSRDADMIISGCGQANFIQKEDVKKDVVLIDCGINRFESELNGQKKVKILGDIHSDCYYMSRFVKLEID